MSDSIGSAASIRCRSCGKVPCRRHKIPRSGHSRTNHVITQQQIENIAVREILRHDLTDPNSKLYQDGFRLATEL